MTWLAHSSSRDHGHMQVVLSTMQGQCFQHVLFQVDGFRSRHVALELHLSA
jgi:hypothetical protein